MNFLDTIQPVASLIISFATLIGLVVASYKFSSDPDAKNKQSISELNVACKLKHQRLDEIMEEMRAKFVSINQSILFIKDNDIKHMEQNIREIRESQNKILTILEYKKTIGKE